MRLVLALALALAACILPELPTERDAGGCGIDCGADTCPTGQRRCGDRCVPALDRDHCGACGNACAAGLDCVAGDGGAPVCVPVCAPNQSPCGPNGACAELRVDPLNCGACGRRCDASLPGVASAACVLGECVLGACAEGFGNCDMRADNGCEVDLRGSAPHCGGCGRACAAPANTAASCASGSCASSCLAGFADCDRSPTNGCEVDLNADPSNCGACARVCTAQPGQVATCAAGVCGVAMALACPSGRGDCNASAVDGCEINVFTGGAATAERTIPHCGACGQTCGFANATARCLTGTCVLGSCLGTFRSCDGDPSNGCEVDTAASTVHCGRCSNPCSYPNASATCMGGACALASCSAGFANCNGFAIDGCEVDTRSSALHCGTCGRACAAGELCDAGVCRLVCPAGQTGCGGRCVDPRVDPAHCGLCGRACATGQVCFDGACAASCPVGFTNCSGACPALASDPAHCGACGATCGAGRSCVARSCALVCAAGQTACGNAFCANLTSDAANCGGCGVSCAGRFANTAANCVNGACAPGACVGAFANCDGSGANGCETQTATDVNHCGACGNRCSFANAAASCASGRCAIGACNTGFADCDGVAENGCEVNLGASVSHCGRCGSACPAGAPGLAPRCVGGVCGTQSVSCSAGTADCDAMSANGCETNILSSLTHCGACGSGCARPNATASCLGGVCVLGACATGFGDCDGNTANGCETSTLSSTAHCSACGRLCSFANAAATCTNGVCALGACATGFASCDGNGTNGCEVNLLADRFNCGACNRQCASGEVCAAGVCAPTCPTGQTNCAGSCVSTSSDRAHCGACGNACAAGRICQGGACVLSCPSGQVACGGACVNPQTDPSHCNVCGNACTGGRVCASSQCVCPSGQTVCSGACVDTRASSAHCGACGSACASPQVCSAGACVTACGAGATNCSGSCVSTQSNAAHCGACGNACALANATSACAGGACVVASCRVGFANCDAMAANGCETNLSNTAASCGGCGNNCNALPGVTSAACVAGRCASLVCVSGRGDCDGNPSNGCEASLTTEPSNCNGCGNSCVNLNQVATATCAAAACSINSCDAGYANCDGQVFNGCETNVRTSNNDCGACGVQCPSTPGNTLNGLCVDGRCNCAANRLDCDNDRSNGCEVNRLRDRDNCGACGVTCISKICRDGACVP